MYRAGSKILDILRQEEKQARLKFWTMLLEMSGQGSLECPFVDEVPERAVFFGKMPEYMRGAFVKAYKLRAEERRAEAEVFEEALSDLLQEHFRDILRQHPEGMIGQFRLGRDWAVYAVPLE